MSEMLAGGTEWWFTESGAQRNNKPQRDSEHSEIFERRFSLEKMQLHLGKIIGYAYSQKGDNFGNKWLWKKPNKQITVQSKADMILEKQYIAESQSNRNLLAEIP